ncbi:MAG TPA: ImmA/IrrE family metallo-endopeptidase [Candidatus Saccharimonadales bacterium]
MFKVDVNPKILIWARNELGFDVSDTANHLNTDEAVVQAWESSGKDLKYTDLRRIAKFYKRQVPTFFLNDVPSKVKKPNDYRNLNSTQKGLHRDTLLAIRRTSRYLALYRDAVNNKQIEEQYQWLKDIRLTKENQSLYLRDLLGTSVIQQRRIRNNNFMYWRHKVEEKLGIFVFQFPIENEEFDGFSYIETGKPFAITLNSKISDNRKVFTIFHELAHIIGGESGICFTDNGARTPYGNEAKCNHFAAEFLMPKDEVIPPISYEELKTNAASLGVSAEAFLIRCHNLDLIEDSLYKELMAIIQAKKREYKKRDSTGGPAPILTSKSQRGNKFFDFVITEYDSQRLSPSVVRDVLGLKVAGLSRQDT